MTSFSAIRSIATSSLMATQVQMQVTSSNIANADVDGYTRKVATQTATVMSGTATGTSVTAVSSTVDKYLLRDVVEAASAAEAASVASAKADSLESLFGTTDGGDDGSGTSITSALDSLISAMSSLSGTIESSTLQAQVVDNLESLTGQLRDLASGIQGLRSDADHEIADKVEEANSAIQAIADLNVQIVAAKARGDSTADLEDQRNTALTSLSKLMDVSYVVSSSGQMLVSTGGGTPLVDAVAHEVSYTPAGTTTADTVFVGITVDGKDITAEISSGSIGALIEQRDETLPAAAEQLDALAQMLIDTLNTAYNSGTSVPAPSTLTGTTTVAATDSLDATGTWRVALVDSEGALSSYADLDLSSFSTVGDLVDGLNAISGITASIEDGHLVIKSSDTSLGVALADTDTEFSGSSEGVSDHFGLNDLLTGSSAATINVRSDIAAGTTRLATSVLSTGTLTAGDTAVAASSAFVAAFGATLDESYSFDAAGGLGATTTTLGSYAAEIIGWASTNASTASDRLDTAQSSYDSYSDALASMTGVNIDEETARLSELEQQYSVASQLLEVLNAMFDALLAAAKSST